MWLVGVYPGGITNVTEPCSTTPTYIRKMRRHCDFRRQAEDCEHDDTTKRDKERTMHTNKAD